MMGAAEGIASLCSPGETGLRYQQMPWQKTHLPTVRYNVGNVCRLLVRNDSISSDRSQRKIEYKLLELQEVLWKG